MDVADQVQAMIKAWIDAQARIGRSWLEAVSQSSEATPEGQDSGAERVANVTAVPGAAPSAVTGLKEGLEAGYRAMVQMFELSLASWAPESLSTASGPGDAQAPADFFVESTRRLQQLIGIQFRDGSEGPRDIAGLTRRWLDGFQKLFVEEFQKLSGPWFEALHPALEHFGRAGADDGSALLKFSDLYWDAYERTMGRLLESPDVGYRREFDERLLRSSRAWLEFRRASFDYFTVLGEAWVRTLIEMTSELESLSKQGKTITNLVELLRLWSAVADRVLIETFGREEYSQVQGRLLNAAMAYRLEERQTADVFLKMSHLPTRSEVDEVTRELYQLRREVRALQKELAQRDGRLVSEINAPPTSAKSAPPSAPKSAQPRSEPRKGGSRSSPAHKGSGSRKTGRTDGGPSSPSSK